MASTEYLRLSRSEYEALERLRRSTKDARSFVRILGLLKLADGEHPEAIAELLEVHPSTVYRWLQRYVEQRQAESVLEQPRSGRPSKSARLDDNRLSVLLDRSPLEYGYRSTVWTVALLRTQLCRDQGLDLSDETLRRYLHRYEYRWKRPKHTYRTTDPHKGQKKGASSQH